MKITKNYEKLHTNWREHTNIYRKIAIHLLAMGQLNDNTIPNKNIVKNFTTDITEIKVFTPNESPDVADDTESGLNRAGSHKDGLNKISS